MHLENGAAGRGNGAAARQVGAHAVLVGDGGRCVIALQLAVKRKEHAWAARRSARIDEEYLQPCMPQSHQISIRSAGAVRLLNAEGVALIRKPSLLFEGSYLDDAFPCARALCNKQHNRIAAVA